MRVISYPGGHGPLHSLMDPSNGEVFAQIQLATLTEALDVIKKLTQYQQQSAPQWTAQARAAVLAKTAQLILNQQETLATQIATEAGKPIKDALIEVKRAALTLTLCAQEALKIRTAAQPMPNDPAFANYEARVEQEPIGLVMAISAFNHPLNLAAHQMGSAIAAGCALLFKPDSRTPLSSLSLLSCLLEAGLPPDALAVVPCHNTVAETLATDSRIQFVNFVGSAKVGWHLRSILAPGTRLALEHGGNAGAIVHDDADLAKAIPAIVKGAFYNAGQVCISTQRLYVHENIFEECLHLLTAATKKLTLGDAKLPTTDVGPLITASAQKRLLAEIEDALSLGGKLICGGKAIGPQFLEPTLLTNVPEKAQLMAEEAFGPILCLNSYSHLDEVIACINQTDYPFQAAIFTRSPEIARQAAEQLKTASVIINDHTAFRFDAMPFGGRKHSGLGLGGVPYSVGELLQPKLIVIKDLSI